MRRRLAGSTAPGVAATLGGGENLLPSLFAPGRCYNDLWSRKAIVGYLIAIICGRHGNDSGVGGRVLDRGLRGVAASWPFSLVAAVTSLVSSPVAVITVSGGGHHDHAFFVKAFDRPLKRDV